MNVAVQEPVAAGHIGPNAILQIVEEVRSRCGESAGRFVLADTPWRLEQLPTAMVAEEEVIAVVHATHRLLGREGARQVLRAAGVRTARYLLANRIPRAAQWVMHLAPPAVAARILLSAIRRNSWTFAGSAQFTAQVGEPTVLEFTDCPMCRGLHGHEPECEYYAATFTTLMQALVSPFATVVETECSARGDERCRFELRFRPPASMP